MSTRVSIHPIKRLIVGLVGAGLCLATSHAAIENAAWLQGNSVADGSTSVNNATPVPISFSQRTSIDPYAYELDAATSSQLTVKQAGDYFVAASLPINASADRSTLAIELYVNGEAIPGAISQCSYVRNTSGHNESSDSFQLLVPGLAVDDVVELMVYQTAGGAANLETASLYVELVDSSRAVFSATATETTDADTNLNRDLDNLEAPAEFAWVANRTDTGFSLSGGDIIVATPGNYLITVNVPMQGSVTRASAGIEISSANGTPYNDYFAQQGYIRNTSGHNEASVHFAGYLQTTEANQVLKVDTVQRATAGTVTIQNGKAASVMIERLPNAGVFGATAREVDDATAPQNWNLGSKTSAKWDDAEIIDASVYQHSAGATQITVRQDGNYLLVYHDNMFEDAADRANPRITVEVNGVEQPGAQTKSHYIRRSNQEESSGTFAYMLASLKANDAITVSSQQEAAGADTGAIPDTKFNYYTEGVVGRVTLIKKPDLVPDPSNPFPPVLAGSDGDLYGFMAQIETFGLAVDEATLEVLLDGTDVTVDTQVSAEGVYVNLDYAYSIGSFPPPGSSHTVTINFDDDGASPGSHSFTFTFTIGTDYTVVPPEFRVDGELGTSGFAVALRQADPADDAGVAVDLANSTQRGEQHIRDLLIDPVTGQVYPNVATVSSTTVEGIINMNVQMNTGGTLAEVGNFTSATGYADVGYPGIPGNVVINSGLENFAIEFVTYLDLPEGVLQLGVNSDDGFLVTTAPNPRDLLGPVVLGEYDGGRGSSDSIFTVIVEEAGWYPIRLLHYQGGGGGNVEFFSVAEDGTKLPINTAAEGAIEARQSIGTGGFDSFLTLDGLSPFPDSIGNPLSASVEVRIRNGAQATLNTGSVNLLWNGESVVHQLSQQGGVNVVTYDPPGDLPLGELVLNELNYEDSNGKIYQVSWSWGVKGEIRQRFFDALTVGNVPALIASDRYQENLPDINDIVDALEINPNGRGDTYASEHLGYFVPYTTDFYTFYLSSDDHSQLFLSTDDNPGSAVLIAFQNASNGDKAWTSGNNTATRKSAEIELQAGQSYFLQVLHREGTGGDRCEVAVRTRSNPDIVDGAPPISGQLRAYNGVGFVGVPAGGDIPEGRSWTFQVERPVLAPSGVPSFQWLKDGSPIAGATDLGYTIPSLSIGDSGTYTLQATVGSVTGTSVPAVLNVQADNTPPTFVSAGYLPGSGAVGLKFDEPVNVSSASFTVAGATVSSSQVMAVNETVVQLVVTGSPAAGFQVTANNVRDKVGNTLTSATVTGQISTLAGADLGTPEETGEAFSFGDGYYVAAGGNDLWTAADSGYFLAQQFTGPFDVRAQVDSLNYGDEWGKAALMARESLDAGSRNQAVLITKPGPFPGPGEVAGGPYFDGGQNLYNHQWRDVTDDVSASLDASLRISPAVYPSWIRLVRESTDSNAMKSYISYDGQAWILLHTYTNLGAVLPESLYIGIAQTAHDNTLGYARAEAVYAQFSLETFVPDAEQPVIDPPAIDGGNITITWTGGGELQTATAIQGPWTGTGNTSGTFSEAAAVAGNKFYRVGP